MNEEKESDKELKSDLYRNIEIIRKELTIIKTKLVSSKVVSLTHINIALIKLDLVQEELLKKVLIPRNLIDDIKTELGIAQNKEKSEKTKNKGYWTGFADALSMVSDLLGCKTR